MSKQPFEATHACIALAVLRLRSEVHPGGVKHSSAVARPGVALRMIRKGAVRPLVLHMTRSPLFF